jgi:hypothetical protein
LRDIAGLLAKNHDDCTTVSRAPDTALPLTLHTRHQQAVYQDLRQDQLGKLYDLNQIAVNFV